MAHDLEVVDIRELSVSDIHESILEDYNRFQEVTKVWRKEAGEWVIRDLCFTEYWDDRQKAELIHEEIMPVLKDGGCFIGAFISQSLIGFALLDGHLIGDDLAYIQLLQFQVSSAYRGQGIGRQLFEATILKAKEKQAKKIYISAHSSVESKGFYDRVGCVEATWLYDKQVELEPYDCQMEYVMD